MAKEQTTFMGNGDDGVFQVCVKRNRYLGSFGVWTGDNPFEFVVPITLFQIIMFVTVSRVLCFVLKPVNAPKFVCYVLGGIILGPTVMSDRQFEILFPPIQSPVLILLSRIGAVYCVFFIALKMDVVTTLRAAKHCWRLGVIPFICSFLVMGILASLYESHIHVNGPPSVEKLPNVSSWTSFAVISDALMELNLITTELGQIALSSAMVTEMMQWILLIVTVTSKNELALSFAFVISLCAFVILLAFVVRPTMRLIIKRTPVGKPVKEGYVVLVLLGVVATSVIGDIIGITYIVGPILYGLVIPNGPPLATTIVERCEVVISELIMPFFYVFIGISTNVTAIKDWRKAMIVECIILAGVFAKLLACVVVAITYNIRPKHGFILGLMLSIKGIVDLILFLRMKKTELFKEEMFTQLVLHAVLLTAIFTPLIKSLYKHRPRVSKAPSIHEGRVRTIQSTSLTSEFNIISCLHHDANVHSMIALLEAFNPSQESPICVQVIHLIELLGKSTPILLPMNKQNKKLLSINYPDTNHIMRAFENYSRNSKGPITVFSYVNVAPYKSMHEAICNLAEDKSVPLIVIPFHEYDQIINSHAATSIRDLNTAFQVHATCTVGILVDRYSRLGLSDSMFSFHVAIFFIGGRDDREALALGIRMLERVNTRVTLLRFVVQNQKNRNDVLGLGVDHQQPLVERQEEEDGMMDDCLVDEFKGKKLNYDNAVCREIVIEDSINVLEAIRRMEMELYDLVIVGKRHRIGSITDEEMTDFMDNADQLGVIGDMLASVELCDGRVSLLVMQCGEKRMKPLDKKSSARVASF